MKKLLALVLALVMTLGLATVGANAALSDYSDGKDVSYTEAMSVMNAVGVFQGSDGKLTPKDELTRAQAAKLIAYLDMGETAAETLPAVQVFADVPATHWASKYIAYCYNAGIIKGAEANKFYPENNVTGYAFGVWLLAVLGYDRDIEGMNGPDWQIRTAALMGETGIGEHVEKAGSAVLTREEAAQYCLESLTATMVGYATKGTDITMADGSTIKVGASAPAARAFLTGVTYNDNGTAAAGTDGTTLQLTEKLYGNNLKLSSLLITGTDPLNRPTKTWSYKGVAVAEHPTAADYTFKVEKVDKTTPGTTDLITAWVTNTIKRTNWIYAANPSTPGATIVSINGNDVQVAPNATALNYGDTVEFYMNDSNVNQIDNIIVIRPTVYTLTADAAARTSPTKNDTTQVIVPGVVGLGTYADNKTAANVIGYEGLKKGDVVMVTTSASAAADNLTYYYITKCETVSGKVTGKSGANKVIVGGTAYDSSALTGTSANFASWDDYSNEYDFYLDNVGRIVKATQKTDSTEVNYAYVLASQWAAATTLGGSSGALARLLFTDGTNKVVSVTKVNGDKLIANGVAAGTNEKNWSAAAPANDNIADIGYSQFVTYTVDANGNYELKTVTSTGADISTDLDSNNVRGAGTGTVDTQNNRAKFLTGSSNTSTVSPTGDANTVFLVNTVAPGVNSTPKVTRYVGIANLPAITGIQQATSAVISSNGIAKYVYIDAVGKTVSGVSSDYVYVPRQYDSVADDYTLEVYDYVPANGSVPAYYEYTAIVNGETTKAKFDERITANGKNMNILYAVVSQDTNGIIDQSALTAVTATTGVAYSGGTISTTGDAYTTNSSTTAYYIDRTGAISPIAVADIVKDDSDTLFFIPTTGGGKTAKTVYVKQNITAGCSVDVVAKVNGTADATAATNIANGAPGTSATHTSAYVCNTTFGGGYSAGDILTISSTAKAGSENCSVVITPSTQTITAAGSYVFNVTVTSEDGKTSTTGTLTVTIN